MRLLLRVLVSALALAAVVLAKKHTDSNRVPPPENPHGSSQYKYTYVSVCRNGTSDSLLELQYAKTCKQEGGAQVALGRYTNQVNTTGWGILEIETFAGHPYDVQAYAAGVAEGELTRLQIYYHYRNTVEELCKGHSIFCKKLYKYLTKNLDWLRSQVASKPPTDHYWRHVNLTFAQMTGIYDSYMKRNLTPEIGFDLTPITMIQLSGEMFDLNKFLNKTPDPQEYPEAGRCSGLLKIAPDNKDMFFSHVAMSSYSTMNRVLKMYKFALRMRCPDIPCLSLDTRLPLSSADDYTLTSGGLASIETTIAIFNSTLYTDAFIKPVGQVHCWIRSFISNALTKTAKDWVKLFERYNSGTYNNQWTVVDYKLFKPGQPIPKTDMLWILEQTPGSTRTRDMTWFLNAYSYWPSYNIPYLTDISIIAGFNTKGAEFDWYKWGGSPRARMFERDHHKVTDIDSLTKLMRYNDYKHEEFARCKCSPDPYTAEGGISARGDLNPVNGTYEVESMGFRNHGGLDYKGTNYEMFSKLRFRAWGGPPFDPLPVFDWANTNVVSPHYGQPQIWNFTYVDLEWETTTSILGFN